MQSNNEWLRDASMNLLVDYYPEVQSRPYGSGCTRENTLPWLKQLKLGYLCVYAKGHSGYTTWPSSLKTRHKMLGQDMPKFYRAMTRATECKLVLYYSGLLDGLAGERHPDWIMINREGKPSQPLFADFKVSIAYPICPQSAYWDEWASIQLRELIKGYDPDGIWVDGDWPGPCYCERCLQRFQHATGWTGTRAEMSSRSDFDAQYAIVWNRITHEWRTRFCAFVKKLKPSCLYSAGNVSPRREFAAPFDWRSGDFFSPGFYPLHDMARMMRWYGTLDVPYDAYVCDTSFTHVRKNVRSRSKTLPRMMQEAATVAASGGVVGYWTYPLGNGAWVPSRMKKAIAVRKFLEEREDVFLHTQSAQWTAILATDPSQVRFAGASGIIGAHKALSALHRSPDVMDESGWNVELPYDLAVVPEQAAIDQDTINKLEAFVQRGGKLLTTGTSIQSLDLQKLLGVSNAQRAAVKDGHVILKKSEALRGLTRGIFAEPSEALAKEGDEPAGFDLPWDKVQLVDARELYPLYLSWDQFNPACQDLANNWPMHGQMDEEHPEPAGFPAAIMRRLGKGCIVHICADIFGQYSALGDPQILRWVREILEYLQPEPFFRTDAPSWVDISLRRKGGSLLIHFVNQNPGRDICKLNTDDTWVDEIPEIGPFDCEIRIRKKPQKVVWEPEGKKIDFHYENQVLSVTIPKIHIHGCLSVLL